MKVLLFLLAAAASVNGADRVPVLAELFTSEGCSDCPPADRLLELLDRSQPVAGAQIIVLSEHVDYWNQLGWRDPYSAAQFSRRQEQYARVLGSQVATPQLVVDGRTAVIANDPPAVQKAIARASERAKAPVRIAEAKRAGGEVALQIAIPPLAKGHAEVWAAVADESDRSSVNRGENAGRTLTHVAVARSLRKIGSVGTSKGLETAVRLPAAEGAARVVVFLANGGGEVLGADAARVP
jgi:hypothetical protein